MTDFDEDESSEIPLCKISELISSLQAFQTRYGPDIDVDCLFVSFDKEKFFSVRAEIFNATFHESSVDGNIRISLSCQPCKDEEQEFWQKVRRMK